MKAFAIWGMSGAFIGFAGLELMAFITANFPMFLYFEAV